MPTERPTESNDEWAARVTRAVRSGSREALAEIYDRCADEIVSSLRRTTRRDESFALDCLQEMFMRLAANPPIVQTRAALFAWMQLSALNAARTMIVSEQRRSVRERHGGIATLEVVQSTDSPEQLLTRLSAEEFELLRLRHVERLSIRALAQTLGATPRAIESALRRLVTRLREGSAS